MTGGASWGSSSFRKRRDERRRKTCAPRSVRSADPAGHVRPREYPGTNRCHRGVGCRAVLGHREEGGDDGRGGARAVGDGGNNAECAASAPAEGPEEVRAGVGVSSKVGTVGDYDGELENVVDTLSRPVGERLDHKK